MRLYIKLSRNSKVIPFSYQHLLTGVVHKWIGVNNNEHGKKSLYSFSGLQNTRAIKSGINLNTDAYFFISSYDAVLIKKIMKGVLNDPETFCGSRVIDIQIKDVPEFSKEERFLLNSPILIRKREGEKTKHVTFLDKDFNELLTQNLCVKLESANISSEGISVRIDENYSNPKTKLIDYKGVKNKTSLVPIIIKGSPEQIAFAWQVGLGNSTGIGFGSIK